MKKLPEYFAIKRKKKDPRWKQYIAYLNGRFGVSLDGTSQTYPWYGYGGRNHHMDLYHNNPDGFLNTVTVMTLDEFFDITDGFVFPEKWCIKTTNENIDILGNWRDDGPLHHGHIGWYLHTPMNNKNGYNQERKENDYTEITFEQFKKYVLKQNTMKNTTVKKAELEQIHNVACSTWKSKITELTLRNPFGELVELTQTEVDEMFAAATESQLPVLYKIFGEREKIDFDKIKMGSKVMIQYTGQHCTGIDAIDLKEPVDVVFYKTPHLIDGYNKFSLNSSHSSYCTFHQNGKFVLFSSDSNVEYITKVVKY
jgi:hypothetical protein